MCDRADLLITIVGDGLIDGEKAARAVVAGGAPDLDALVRGAEGMNVLRLEIAKGTMSAGWIRPTEDDVSNARHLVQLVREGAPREELLEPARRVVRVIVDPNALGVLCDALLWLEEEASRLEHLAEVRKALDVAVSLFERGCDVDGFVPTLEDLARLRRLREIAITDGAEALEERRLLVAELWARMPRDYVSECDRRRAFRASRALTASSADWDPS